MTTGITIDRAISPREKRYYPIMILLSVIIWLAIAITIVGAFYAIAGAIFVWFGNGLLVAYLKSESVKISEKQLPELYQTFKVTCDKLGCTKMPELFLMQEGGTLNAFATRHSGRDFVVLFSDIVEAYGEKSAEVMFIMGHEIGHVERKHIFKRLLTLPASLVPLLGSAYSRACEATCDRYGLIASGDPAAAKRAMMILSGGKEAGRKMDSEKFALQHQEARGFFVSWHELGSGYPTLSQRVFNLASLAQGQEPIRVSRSVLAYLFALIFSRSSFVLIFIAYIGIIGTTAFKSIKAGAEKKESYNAAVTSEDLDEDEFTEESEEAEHYSPKAPH